MKYAVIQLAGKQLKVAEGDTILVNKMASYDPVILAYSQDGALELGNPTITGVTLTLTPQAEKKAKTIVFRYKSKSRYRKTKGHKQPLVSLKVENLYKGEKPQTQETHEKNADTSKSTKTAKPVKSAKPKTSTKKEEKAKSAK